MFRDVNGRPDSECSLLLLLLLGFMANCNHVLSGAYRHLLYRSMQHGLAYSSMILLNKKIKNTGIK